jgi:UDP-N-acetylglucosamine acyltransferase
MTEIHSTAIIDPAAKLGEGVAIGPFCVIGPDVELGDGVVLHSHVVVTGLTRVGARTKIFPFASIGHAPQDLKYKGERTRLVIGEDNTIREHVTMNPGTADGLGETLVGSRGLYMMGAHVAHDCIVGDNVIMANNATLAGHVTVGDHAIIGGLSAVHQFVRIGQHAMIGGMSGIEHDVIPFGLAMGERARLNGLNLIGLKRRGYDRAKIQTMMKGYSTLFASEGALAERIDKLAQTVDDSGPLAEILSFVQANSSRRLCQPK